MTVENGQGLENADSYVSVEYADEYFVSRDSSWSELADEEKEKLLVKATDFVDASFKWRGKKSTQEQALGFPRINCVNDDGFTVAGVPTALKKAVCESALLVKSNGNLFQTNQENGAVVSEHIGSISFTYDTAKKQKDTTLYDSINLRLRGLFVDTSKGQIMSMKVERV